MDGWFPPVDCSSGDEDATESVNLWLTEVWLMDEGESGENWSSCVPCE